MPRTNPTLASRWFPQGPRCAGPTRRTNGQVDQVADVPRTKNIAFEWVEWSQLRGDLAGIVSRRKASNQRHPRSAGQKVRLDFGEVATQRRRRPDTGDPNRFRRTHVASSSCVRPVCQLDAQLDRAHRRQSSVGLALSGQRGFAPAIRGREGLPRAGGPWQSEPETPTGRHYRRMLTRRAPRPGIHRSQAHCHSASVRVPVTIRRGLAKRPALRWWPTMSEPSRIRRPRRADLRQLPGSVRAIPAPD